ncbi:hypothetical protein, partial [Streptomyces sp. NPDC048057]|uniref:hypothetical protein n=1 Tax=Streptomyces sp. NPDC048057 TaxID=3155628 RepID=UPI003400C077
LLHVRRPRPRIPHQITHMLSTNPNPKRFGSITNAVARSDRSQLDDSEVERARTLKLDETYIIVYVSHVLDGARRRITPLPNPFGAPGLAEYCLMGSALRLRFTLPRQ